MQINVAQLLKSQIGSYRNYVLGNAATDDGLADLVEGALALVRIDRGILVEGDITAVVSGECNRCLEPLTKTIKFQFSEEFLPSLDIVRDKPLEYTSEMLTIDKNHILDLSHVIKQYIIMFMPSKMLCKENCRGICVSCGVNLNRSNCNCSEMTTRTMLKS